MLDLLNSNRFAPVDHSDGPHRLSLALVDRRLMVSVATEKGGHVLRHHLSLTPFRQILKDRSCRIGHTRMAPLHLPRSYRHYPAGRAEAQMVSPADLPRCRGPRKVARMLHPKSCEQMEMNAHLTACFG
ncbi:UPF0262 family protein [Ensifer sp. NBAIM29]|nr:UPF0262 family protein [Ensifer sp. NBAIM29]